MTQDYSSTGGKPCRACTDFKNWMKVGPKPPAPASETESTKTGQKGQESVVAEEKSGQIAPKSDPVIPPKVEGAASPASPAPAEGNAVNVDLDQAALDAKQGVCPPDRGELGSATWSFLHSVAAYYPSRPTEQHQEDAKRLMHIVSRLYPCSDCAEDLRQDLVEEPPVVSSSVEFSQWLCRLHNRVNVKLGKPVFDCSRVFERWRDGWKDGSCD